MTDSLKFEEKIFKDASVIAIYGGSLGDEWKGKATWLFNNVDYVATATWGGNAGHTVYYKGKKIVLHELPGGAIIEKAKVYLGQGRVLNISGLETEIKELESIGCSPKGRIYIAGNIHIILKNLHRELDWIIEEAKSKAVGTTKKGIWPAYALKALRMGITVNMMLTSTKDEIEDVLKTNCNIFKSLNYNSILQEYIEEFEKLNKLIASGYIQIDKTNMEINKAVEHNKKILVEASQSAMLSIDWGMYPYCTSSDTSINGITSSLKIQKVDKGIAVMKAIKSKVGGGFFPTKMEESIAQPYRTLSWEFWATTGRPRDVGYFDLVEARYVLSQNKTDVLFITKADLLSSLPEVKIWLSYSSSSGAEYKKEIPFDSKEYETLKVNYSKAFKLTGDIYGITEKKDLPECYIEYFDYLIEELGFKGTVILGTWPNDNQYLIYN